METAKQFFSSIPGAVWVLVLAGALMGIQTVTDDPVVWQLATVIVMLLAKAIGVNFDEVESTVKELGGQEVVVQAINPHALPTRPEYLPAAVPAAADQVEVPLVKTKLPSRIQRFLLG